MFNLCDHKFGLVQKDNYQYCEKCGKALNVSCDHKWDIIGEIFSNNSGKSNGWVLQCQKCGDLKNHSVNS